MSKIDQSAPDVAKKSEGQYSVGLNPDDKKPCPGDPCTGKRPSTKTASGGPKDKPMGD